MVRSIAKDFRGVVIANEVLDALPVHLLETCSENHLRSLHVELAGGQVQWAYTAPDSRVSAALQQRGINLYPNYRYEISLDIKPFLYDLYQKMDSVSAYSLTMDTRGLSIITRIENLAH